MSESPDPDLHPGDRDSQAAAATPEAQLERVGEIRAALLKQLSQQIVGQQETINQVLITLLAGGHCLLVGVPGLAKTLLVHSLASSLSLDFSRIQFTPDLMPADITGTEVIQEDRAAGTRRLTFLPGPIFANIILADEINRTPPKTQAALLEAMQEGQVTAGGEKHTLPRPFFVLATQNPIEQEGTYPLPEAQLDRFMFNILIDYPSEDDEVSVVVRTTSDIGGDIEPVVSGAELMQMSRVVRSIALPEPVARYATRLARATRPAESVDEEVRKFVAWGAGPRASQYLVLGAKAQAALDGRPMVERDDIDRVAHPVLRHRVRCNYAASIEGFGSDQLIDLLIERVRHRDASTGHGSVEKVFRTTK